MRCLTSLLTVRRAARVDRVLVYSPFANAHFIGNARALSLHRAYCPHRPRVADECNKPMHAADATTLVLAAMRAVCDDGAVDAFYRIGILEKGSAYLFNLVHILADNIGDIACLQGVEAMLLAMRVCPNALLVQEDGCAVLATVGEYGASSPIVFFTQAACHFVVRLSHPLGRGCFSRSLSSSLARARADAVCRQAIVACNGVELIEKAKRAFPDAAVLCECADMILEMLTI